MSGCAESGFGPASTPLELQRIVVGSVPPEGGVVPPRRTSCHCWYVLFVSVVCTMFAPFAVEAPCTESALLLWRLIRRTYPLSELTSRNCWLVPFRSVHWTICAFSAVDHW